MIIPVYAKVSGAAKSLAFKLNLESFLNLRGSEHLDDCESKAHIEDEHTQFVSVDCCLKWAAILHVDEEHHRFDSTADCHDEYLAEVHRRVSHVVNPHRYEVHEACQEAKDVSSTDCSSDLSIHNRS